MLAATVFCFQFAGHAQTKIGVSGGVNVAEMKGKVAGDGKSGVMTGLVLETPVGNSFTFRPSLNYVQKGQLQPPTGLVDKLYLALRYTELNADFLYYISGEKGGFFIGAGPSISLNLPSKRVSITDKVKTTNTIKYGKTVGNDLRGFDYGANFTTGWRTNGGFFLSVNYNRGLRNLVIENDPGSLKNQYIGVQLGVFINNGKSEK